MGGNSTKVTSISGVRRGDHIAYKNGWFYHHGIVVDIDVKDNIITVIHYLHNSLGSSREDRDNPAISYAKVREEVIDVGLYVTKDALYRYLYEDHQCVPAEDVVVSARSHKDRAKFAVIYNNCEDFAVRCKTIAAGVASTSVAAATAGDRISVAGEMGDRSASVVAGMGTAGDQSVSVMAGLLASVGRSNSVIAGLRKGGDRASVVAGMVAGDRAGMDNEERETVPDEAA